MPTIQASSVKEADFFNSLLVADVLLRFYGQKC